MKRIAQREDDGCFAACLAMMLEIDLATIPNHCPRAKSAPDLYCRYQRWLARHHGLSIVSVARPDDCPFSEWVCRAAVPVKFIACVPVEAGEWHAVVASFSGRRARVLHDPAPYRRGRISLRRCDSILFLVPLKPATLAKGSRLK